MAGKPAAAVVLALLLLSGCAVAAPTVCAPRACYRVETARTPEARQKGLMSRPSLKAGEGMLFVFDREGIYPFWMKNMNFAIDIIWIDANRQVVEVRSNVPPCAVGASCEVYTPSAAAAYVLEVPSGDAQRYRITPGAKLQF